MDDISDFADEQAGKISAFMRITDDELIRDGITGALARCAQISKEHDVETRAHALVQQTACHILTGAISEADQSAQQAIDHALAYGKADARLAALTARGRVDCLRGRFTQGCAALEQALKIAAQLTSYGIERPHSRYQQHELIACGVLATSYFLQGERQQSMAALRRGYALAMDSGKPYMLGTLHSQLAQFHQLRGEEDQALDAAMEAIAIAEKHDYKVLLSESSIHYWIAAGTGEANSEAASSLRALMGLRKLLSARTQAPYFLYGLSKVHQRLGDKDAARDAIDDAVDQAMNTGETCHLALLLTERARIRLATNRERRTASVADAKKAFYIAATQKARFLQNSALSLLPSPVPHRSPEPSPL